MRLYRRRHHTRTANQMMDETSAVNLDYALWSRSFPEARTWKSRGQQRAQFSHYQAKDLRERAAFFYEAGRHLPALGIENPIEPVALSFQALHPFTEEESQIRLCGLGYSNHLAGLLLKTGFELLDFSFVEKWFQESLFSELKQELGFQTREYLVDPYSGFLLWSENGRHRNTPLVYGAWFRHMVSLQPESSRWMREHKEDTLLSQGALLSRHFFPDIISNIESSSYAEVPEILVTTDKEFSGLIARLTAATSEHSGVSLWYRGQPMEYLLPDRMEVAASSIAPYANVRDASLIPSLYRYLDNHLRSMHEYERLCRCVAEWVRRANSILGPTFEVWSSNDSSADAARLVRSGAKVTMNLSYQDPVHPRLSAGLDTRRKVTWNVLNGRRQIAETFETLHPSALASTQRSLILQHYGCPTGALDVTRNPRTAAWFAFNSLEGHAGKLEPEPITWSGSDPSKWPVLYTFIVLDRASAVIDSAKLLQDTGALRPVRQECGLLCGAGHLAKNYPARYLGLKIRFAPGCTLVLPRARDLFPGPGEDRALASLLDLQTAGPEDAKTLYPVYTC